MVYFWIYRVYKKELPVTDGPQGEEQGFDKDPRWFDDLAALLVPSLSIIVAEHGTTSIQKKKYYDENFFRQKIRQ